MHSGTVETMEPFRPWGMEENTFNMLMHLSQFAGYVLTGAGLVLPIVMWAMNKDRSETVDVHGRIILNWMISMVIYAMITLVLCFFFVGFLILPVLVIIAVVFPIIGAVRANNGEAWPYPMSIRFFAV